MPLNRIVTCTINFITISGIKIDFDIKKTDTKDPNIAIIKLYNIAEATKRLIIADAGIQINAGYWDVPASAIFIGRVKFTFSERDSSGNTVTVIEAFDEAKGLNQGTSLAIPIGGSVSTVVNLMATQLNSPLATPLINDSTFQNGFSFIGTVKKCLDLVVRDRLKLEWSIQDNLLYILAPETARISAPLVLNSGNGLIGQVEIEKDETPDLKQKAKLQEDKIKFQSLLIPRAGVGLPVTITSLKFNGTVKIKELVMKGDSEEGRMISEYIGCRI